MAQQEGVEDKYFDIMLVGMTGQGKSTMADKLLIANPGKLKYVLSEQLEDLSQGDARIWLEDISMWQLHEGDERGVVETHLKALVNSRTKPKPHVEVNNLRDPEKKSWPAPVSARCFPTILPR